MEYSFDVGFFFFKPRQVLQPKRPLFGSTRTHATHTHKRSHRYIRTMHLMHNTKHPRCLPCSCFLFSYSTIPVLANLELLKCRFCCMSHIPEILIKMWWMDENRGSGPDLPLPPSPFSSVLRRTPSVPILFYILLYSSLFFWTVDFRYVQFALLAYSWNYCCYAAR